jgi:hypothetical protein
VLSLLYRTRFGSQQGNSAAQPVESMQRRSALGDS